MTKTYSLLFVTFFLASCTKDLAQNECHKRKDCVQPITANVMDDAPEVIVEEVTVKASSPAKVLDVPKSAQTWAADVYLVNFTGAQEAKVLKAVQIIKRVIASQEFKDRVLNYQYQGKKQFFDHGGLSNQEVYEKILAGAEQMGNTSQNNVMDVELELYSQATSTIGYTYPNTVRIWMNRKYFNKYTPVNVADNLMHEWMHKLGFTHATTWSESRDHSVPYAIGYLIEELASKYLD